jgi:hypothetical protein
MSRSSTPFKPPDVIDEVVYDDLRRCFGRLKAFDFALTAIRRLLPTRSSISRWSGGAVAV